MYLFCLVALPVFEGNAKDQAPLWSNPNAEVRMTNE